jgi:hypothetical protein
MKNNNLTPEQSLELIISIITDARNRFQQNGYIFVFWGILIAIASFGHFFLLEKGLYSVSWYPYVLMPVGAIITGVYYSKLSKKNNVNQIIRIVSVNWSVVSINILFLGFLFALHLRENLIPIILILLSIGILVSAGATKSNWFYFSGVVINVSGMICFYLPPIYHSLLMGIVAVVAILIPGIILSFFSKRNV